MPLVLGVDSSTQSTKVEVRDADSGEVIAAGRAPHPQAVPPRSEQDPDAWWTALVAACGQAVAAGGWSRRDVAAISVAGQQHGMVVLDAHGRTIRPAKLWNDTESAGHSTELVARLGAPTWAEACGSVPVAAFTVTKLAWLAHAEPEAFASVRRVLLPHDWLTLQLTGTAVTDRGDASGTGYWSPHREAWCPELLDEAAPSPHPDGWEAALPRVLGPTDVAGALRPSAAEALGVGTSRTIVAAGTGDNMAGALGVGLRPGDLAVSLGTSGTVYAVSLAPTADPTGAVAGFADATGCFLPLACTLNATLVTEAVARLLGVDLAGLDALAGGAPGGAGGMVLVPHLAGERTPNRPGATGTLHGIRADVSREAFARAAFEGVACGLLDGVDALAAAGVAVTGGRLLLLGGGARSAAYRRAFADLTQRAVTIPAGDEHVATGAAVQAAAALATRAPGAVREAWPQHTAETVEPDRSVDASAARAAYDLARG